MYGLGLGSISTSLTIDSPVQIVGKQPVYRIQGGLPGAPVFWSSELNGKPTGEVRNIWGTVEANGTLEITGGNWRTEDVGNWRKEIEIPNADGTTSNASVYFQVVPQQTAQSPVINTSSDLFSNPLFYLGDFAVTPKWIGLGVIGIWAAKALKIIK